MWIKIENKTFSTRDICVQLNTSMGASIYIDIDLSTNNDCYDIFINKYENPSIGFNLESTKFLAFDCYITMMDVIKNKSMKLNLVCNLIDTDVVKKRRDSIIEDLLNKKEK